MAKIDIGGLLGGLVSGFGNFAQARQQRRQSEQEEKREKLRMLMLEQRQKFEAEDRQTAADDRARQMEQDETNNLLRYVGPYTSDPGTFNASVLTRGRGTGAMQPPPQMPAPLPSQPNVGDFAREGGLLGDALSKRWGAGTPASQFGTPPIAPPPASLQGGGGWDPMSAVQKAGGFKPNIPEQTNQQKALQQFFMSQSENVERPNDYLPYISRSASGQDIPETGQPEINAQLPLTTGLPGTGGSTPYRQPGKIGLDQLAGLGGRTKLQVQEDTATAKAREAGEAKVEAARALSEGRLDVQEAKIFADLLKITDPSTAMSTILQRRQMAGGKAAPEGTPGLSNELLQGPAADVDLKEARAGQAKAMGEAATSRAATAARNADSIIARRDKLAPAEFDWLVKRTSVAGAAQSLKENHQKWLEKYQDRLATVTEDKQALEELKHNAQNAVAIGKLHLEQSRVRQAEKAKAAGKAAGTLKETPRQQYLRGRIQTLEGHINKLQVETGATPKGLVKNLMDLTTEFESITKVLEDEEKAARGAEAGPATAPISVARRNYLKKAIQNGADPKAAAKRADELGY